MSTVLALLAGALLALPPGPAASRLRHLAGRTGENRRRLDLRPEGVVVRSAVVGIGVGVAVLVGPGPGLAAAILLGTAVEMWRRSRVRLGTSGTLGDWVEVLEDTVAGIRSGAGPRDALDRAAHRCRGAVSERVAVATAVGALGGSAPAALAGGGDPVGAEIAAAWHMAERHGVPTADVLDRIRADLVDRRDRARRVDASLAGPRATGTVLAALPPVGVVLGSGLGADPLGVLASGALGGVLAVIGAVLLSCGTLWTDALIAGARR